MKKLSKYVMCCMLTAVMVSSAWATTITSLGVDTDRGEFWRSTNYVKTALFDPSGDNAYGTDGYYCIQSVASGGARTVLQSLPSYISSLTTIVGLSNYSGYRQLDNPTQPIGVNVSNMPYSGVWYKNGGTVGNYYDYFTFTLAQNAEFVLTAIMDSQYASIPVYGSPGIKVVGTGGLASEQLLSANGLVDYVFFKINGSAGDTFSVQLKIASGGSAATAGLGFEAIPEPATVALLCLGSCFILKRRK